MTNQYHATPYDISATGLYFSIYEEYTQKAATHKNEYGDPVEEYEIQFIDGTTKTFFTKASNNGCIGLAALMGQTRGNIL